jgi:dipeptidase E
MRLLLLSNSTCFGQGYLDHAMGEIVDFFGPVKSIAFIPFALQDQPAYTARARERFAAAGLEVHGVTPDDEGLALVGSAEGVFVGGGNTFRLLDQLLRSGLLPMLRSRVLRGMPYLGASAGSNVAAPTIKTTNDMPIVQPASFEAIGLVPFQINPHYLDPAPDGRHMGETREERLREYLEENEIPALGVREGGWLRREGNRLHLGGGKGARLFRRGVEPEEIPPGADLGFLLHP